MILRKKKIMSNSTISQPSLVINKLSGKKYHDLSINGKLKDSEIYIITDDSLDAVDCVIKNVASPSLSSDATNKDYVDKTTVSSTSFADKTYIKSKMTLEDVYNLLFDVVEMMGATVNEIDDSDIN